MIESDARERAKGWLDTVRAAAAVSDSPERFPDVSPWSLTCLRSRRSDDFNIRVWEWQLTR